MAGNTIGNFMGDVAGDLMLYRTGPDKDGYETGYLMFPKIGKMLTTRERGHGYVSLRIGKYTMKHSIKNTGRQVKCLRQTEGSISTILIHDAYSDRPDSLEGCIAPGIIGGGANWQNSAQAMEQLWRHLDGWESDKEITLQVMTNVSYVSAGETRNDWGRTN
jgi:hypothetical protein